MYSDVFCKVYNELGWNYYPEIFGEQLLTWLRRMDFHPESSLDLGCGTGVLREILQGSGIQAAGMDLSEGMIAIARQRNTQIEYAVADMITFRPERQFQLVTCTGDALNHIGDPEDLLQIFRNIQSYTQPGGYFIFDILNENEVSTSEPFEMDFDEKLRVWFQMTRPEENKVHLTVRVFENGVLQLEEVIRETVHEPRMICGLLEQCGFVVESCTDRLLEDSGPGTTWFVVARKI
jgi:2-polyprenyl-3-methyl-5-hydroxy-6-metoxy-1,4-benzoquinol methylase